MHPGQWIVRPPFFEGWLFCGRKYVGRSAYICVICVRKIRFLLCWDPPWSINWPTSDIVGASSPFFEGWLFCGRKYVGSTPSNKLSDPPFFEGWLRRGRKYAGLSAYIPMNRDKFRVICVRENTFLIVLGSSPSAWKITTTFFQRFQRFLREISPINYYLHTLNLLYWKRKHSDPIKSMSSPWDVARIS